ncbi:hypothetical protein MTR_2g063090 [Medicago truncatula]|uniref:Uncharacterized protein n=1 Tax=Medicago truncatula TaxID=3880 RepID=A0A072V8N6_MEDTR|nr:hypothetical protein MTR_2g063090 [Medicago truncatula]
MERIFTRSLEVKLSGLDKDNTMYQVQSRAKVGYVKMQPQEWSNKTSGNRTDNEQQLCKSAAQNSATLHQALSYNNDCHVFSWQDI